MRLETWLSAPETVPAEPPTRYCAKVHRARVSARGGDLLGAAGHLAGVYENAPLSILPHLAAYEAELRLSAGSAEGVERLLDIGDNTLMEVPGETEREALRVSLLELRLRTDVVRQNHEAVLEAARPLFTLSPKLRPFLLATRARAHRHLGQLDDARSLEARLLIEYPEAVEAMAIERRLEKRPGLLAPDEAAQRIENLIKASRLEKAAAEAVAYPRAPKVQTQLEVATTRALVRADRVDEALTRLDALAASADLPTPLDVERAWALGKAHRHRESADLYAALAEDTEVAAERAEWCFLSGFLLYESEAYDEAEARLAACEEKLKASSFEVPGLWYRALIALLRQRPEAALPLLSAIVGNHATNREHDKHRYWLARALAATGDDKGATKLWRELDRGSPFGYYGLLARRALGLPPRTSRPVDKDALLAKVPHDKGAKRTLELFALGFDAEARASVRDRGRANADSIALAQAIGDYFYGFRQASNAGIAYRLERETGHRKLLPHDATWRAAYAEPHADIVKSATASVALEPAFAYAIMRTESGFLENAQSHAGARGIIQLMPYSARGMARVLGQPPPSASDLDRAEVVIPLGVAFLATSKREFGNHLLAAACYNGGPQHVQRWVQKFGSLGPELFVERIPFKETRDYVKKVLSTHALYRALDGNPLVLDFPDAIPPAPEVVTAFAPTDNEDG